MGLPLVRRLEVGPVDDLHLVLDHLLKARHHIVKVELLAQLVQHYCLGHGAATRETIEHSVCLHLLQGLFNEGTVV